MMLLNISNFLGIRSASIAIRRPVTAIFGPHASGKTSILDAIRCLFGCRVRQTASKDRKRLGSFGERFSLDFSWTVSRGGPADVTDDMELHATASKIPSVDEVSEAVGISRRAIPYCLEPAEILSAKPKQIRELLSEVLKLDYDWKAALMKERCDPNLVVQLPEDPKKAAKFAEAERAKYPAEDLPEGPEDEEIEIRDGKISISEIKPSELETELSQLRADRGDLMAKLAAIEQSAVKKTPKQWKDIEARIDALALEARRIEPASKFETLLLRNQKEREKLQAEHNKAEGRQSEVQNLRMKISQWIEVDLCEKCRKLIERLEMKRAGQDQALENQRAKLIERIAKLVKEEATITDHLTDSREKEARIRAEIEELTKLVQGRDAAADADEIREAIEDLNQRITWGEEIKGRVLDWGRRKAEATDKSAEVADRHKMRAAWDKIMKTLPMVEGNAIKSGLGPFREILEGQALLDGTLEVLEADGLEINFEGRSIDLMSDSELYRLGLVLQSAIVELFGFPFFVIDRTDILVDLAARAAFSETVFRIAEHRPVIFFRAVDPDAIPEIVEGLEDNESVDLYSLTAGVARRLTK